MNDIINIKDLKFTWQGAENPVLNIPEFTLGRGEHTFLEGPSGSGKSTFLNIISGVLQPQQGKISILKQDITSLSAVEKDTFRGQHMGFIFQTFNLLPYLSAVENVTLPCQISKLKKERVLSHNQPMDTQAKELLARLGLKEESLIHKPASHLSIGQQQRVAAARALLGSPELIIADEPTSALDHGARNQFISLLFQEAERNASSILFVSHDKTLGSLFKRSVSLKDISLPSEST